MNRLFGRSKDNKAAQSKQKPIDQISSNNQRKWNSGASRAQSSNLVPKQVGQMVRNPLAKKVEQKIKEKHQDHSKQLQGLLNQVYNLDTNAQNYIDFKPKWTKFKQVIAPHFKVVGFEIRPITQIGNQALKCGKFISKNTYASATITFRVHYNKYKDGISRNKKDFDQFFKVFLKQQEQRQKEANIKGKKHIENKANLKRIQDPKQKVNQIGGEIPYPQLGQYQPITATYKPSLFSKQAQQKLNLAPEQKKSEKKQTKVSSKSPEKKKDVTIEQTKKIDYNTQYILDYFEINDTYTLDQVQIQGLLDSFEGTYAIFFVRIKKTKKQATVIGIIKQKQNYDEDKRILKKIEGEYQNLCFLNLEGKSLEQVWAN